MHLSLIFFSALCPANLPQGRFPKSQHNVTQLMLFIKNNVSLLPKDVIAQVNDI